MAEHKQECKEKYEEADRKYKEYYDKYEDYHERFGRAMQQVANQTNATRMMEKKVSACGEKIADLNNQLVDLHHNYEREKKELKEALEQAKQSTRTPASRTPATTRDDRDSRDGSGERSPRGEPMDIGELRDKFDDMKEDLEQNTNEVKDLEKQLEDWKKTK